MQTSEIIHDWNGAGALGGLSQVELLDETLRDGIQSPSAIDPPSEVKVQLLRLLAELGVTHCDIGLPGAGPRARADVTLLARTILEEKLPIRANCAARTVIADIAPVVDVSQSVGVPLDVYTFIGSSPIRQYAEEWDLDFIVKQSTEAITFAVSHGLKCTYVTEDTTRSRPEALTTLFRAAIDAGASRLCLCDTVGHATPNGARALVAFARSVAGPTIGLDWHGHNDRGLALANALAAGEAGATRLHGTALGIGERVGNTPLDQLLVNFQLLGLTKKPLTRLLEFVRLASKHIGQEIPVNYPLAGRDAFRTATGVHAAAIIKAQKKGDIWLADRIYSGVPAGEFGKSQEIEIGPMSGLSNVRYWLAEHGVAASDDGARAVLAVAKSAARTLTESEIRTALEDPAK